MHTNTSPTYRSTTLSLTQALEPTTGIPITVKSTNIGEIYTPTTIIPTALSMDSTTGAPTQTDKTHEPTTAFPTEG